ncbi:MAG: glycoside hydrolase family 3 C-terminal domain-containing protein [Eubacteriales bacterium]|jgi:beta-glucosidase
MTIEERISKMTLDEKASYLVGKDYWKTKEYKDVELPSFMMCDGPNGLRKQEGKGDHLGINESIKTVCYPTASMLAASFDPELARELGEHLGDECQREHVSMLLGPGINMKRSPICGRNFEYYSEDPYLAGTMAVGYIRGLQSRHVAACPKHFAGNNQETQRMSGSSYIDERTLHEIYLAAFEKVVKEADPKSIMCAYNMLNGTYCSENKELLTDLLRDKWGFKGFVVTDWGASKDAVKGVEAGVDLIMPGISNDSAEYIADAVRSGKLDERLVDEACARIMRTMFWSRDGQPKDVKPSDDTTRESDYSFARKVAENSAILLKNEAHTLPLGKDEKIAFIGAFAEKPRYQGSGSSHINSAKVTGALACARAEGRNVIFAEGYDLSEDPEKDEVLLKEAAALAKKVDKVVIFAGLPNKYESEGYDRRSMAMPENQNRLIREIASVNPNTVVVLHNGSAVEMPWADDVAAVLEMMLAGDACGEAAVHLLYGDVNPSGKLAESYPMKLSDNPSYLDFGLENHDPHYGEGIFIGYRYYDKKEMDVRYPFGHGLSYTTFGYSDLAVDKVDIRDTDTITVSLQVTNTGDISGKEVVQLYVGEKNSKVARPVKELRAFRKIFLEPGETKKVQFTLGKRDFAYYEPALHDFYAETGDYFIMAGSSSRDIRLTADVHLEATEEIPVRYTINTSIGKILSTKKGREVFGPILQALTGGAAAAEEENKKENGSEAEAGKTEELDTDVLGETEEGAQYRQMLEMPLSSMVSLAGMPRSTVVDIVRKLNS